MTDGLDLLPNQKPTLSRLKFGLSGSWQPDCWIM